MTNKVILFGAYSQFADLSDFYIKQDTDYEIVGYTMDEDYIKETSWHDKPVVPFETVEEHFSPYDHKMFAFISYKKVNKIREQKYREGKKKGYDFISYISPKATYYNTPVGENCFIFEDNTIQPFTEIGNNCILWSGNHIGHHTVIKDHNFLTSHVVVSGSVVVNEKSFIGVNATLRDNITIGKEVVIGAGSVVLKDVEDFAVVTPGGTKAIPKKSYELRGI